MRHPVFSKRVNFLSHQWKKGDELLEALIGIFLMGVVGVNTTNIISKSAVAERDNKMNDAAIHQLRYLLMQNGVEQSLCSGVTDIVLPSGEYKAVEVIEGCSDTSVIINGATIGNAKSPVVLRTSSAGGDIHVGGTVSPDA